MNYRFQCKVVDEDTDEVIALGSTYVEPLSVNYAGECESVDMEVGRCMRIFKNEWLKLQEPIEIEDEVDEPLDFTGAGDPLDNDR